MKKRSFAYIYLFLSLAVLVVSIAIGARAGIVNVQTQRDYLLQRVTGLTQALPADKINALEASEDDLDTKNYKDIKQTLQNIAEVNQDIAFAYITKLKGEEVYFVADSEEEGSEDESPAGQLYEEIDAEYMSVHKGAGSMVMGPTRDRWGNWLSGASPITYKGVEIAVFGMDIPADDYYLNAASAAASVFVPSLLVAILFFVGYTQTKLKEKDHAERMRLIGLVTSGVKAPLEGIDRASNELALKLAADPHLSRLTSHIVTSVKSIEDVIEDIVGVTGIGTETKQQDRVDVVAVVVDVIDQVTLSAMTRHVAVRMGDSWPASFVVDTNLKDFSRLINAIVMGLVEASATNETIEIKFVQNVRTWGIEFVSSRPGQSQNTNDATLVILAEQLGAQFRREGALTSITFTAKGTEHQR